MEICSCYGEPARFEIAEVYLSERELILDACCEANLEGWLDAFRAASRKVRAEWMLREAGVAVHDIVVSEDSITWTLDYGLRLEKISLDVAKQFIAMHHRHCDPPVGWKFGAAVLNGSELVGVMTAGRPVSAALAKQGCIEVNRVCVEDREMTIVLDIFDNYQSRIFEENAVLPEECEPLGQSRTLRKFWQSCGQRLALFD